MAQLLHSTRFKSPSTAVSSFNVTVPATTAGSKLVCVSGGGAIVTAKLGVGGTSFTKRTTSLSIREVAAQDIVDSTGSTTTIQIVLNGPENVDGMIFEFASGSLGNFIAGKTQSDTGGNTSTNTEGRAKVGSLTTSGAAVLFTMFTAGDTFVTTPARAFWGLEPLGKQFSNEGINNDASKTTYWSMIGVSDQSSAGTFTAQSSRIFNANEHQSVAWAYEDLSGGVPTYTNPYPNAIAAENSLPGSLSTTWFVASDNATNSNISGYTDSVSYAPGDTVNFNIYSNNVGFNVEIVRLGFYGYESFGARSQATVAGTPAVQPAPTVNAEGGTECAWSATATWAIPSTATPGIYAYIMRRTDNSSFFSQGLFVVRSTVPSSQSSGIMLTTAEFTWQAYNLWGATSNAGATSGFTGRSLYGTAPTVTLSGRAFAVSFERPMGTPSANPGTYFWDSESALVNFLEGNGYDISYYTMTDVDKDTTIPSKFHTAIVQGHSEYWSANFRTALDNARNTGVTNLIFLTSNTGLWHVRFGVSDTNRRKMICYKDSHDTVGFDSTTKYDPVSYTGTWRDSRTTPGGVNNTDRRPESGITGQWFIGNGTFRDRIAVADTYKNLPIWRNTRVASSSGIALRGTNSNSITTAGTSCSIDQPSSTQVGDLFIIAIVFNGSPGNFTGNGLRIVSRQASDTANQTTVILQGYANVAGTTTYNFSWTGSLMTSQVIAVYSGAVWEDSNSTMVPDTSASTTHTTLSTANGGTGRWALCVFADTSNSSSSKTTTWTAGSGLTSRVQANNAGAAAGIWSSIALMDTNSSVTQGSHQYSATAEFGNAHAAAGIMYLSPGTTLFTNTIGDEWDYVKAEEPSTPTNMVMLSRQALQINGQRSNYYGSSYTANGTLFYGLTLYKATSGALVFNAGSWHFQLGLSRIRSGTFDTSASVDVAMQQATVNLLKDFGHSPAVLLSTTANGDATALVDPGAAASPSAYGFDVTTTSYQNIFNASTFPLTSTDTNDNTDYNFGTLFTADANGKIYGARWYFPDLLPAQPVVATLYQFTNNATGVSLGTLTFSNCQSGWNQALFSSPISITANTKYVISVWTSDHYVSSNSLFASAATTNGDLTAPQDTVGAHNGKFLAGAGSSTYPTGSFSGSGYLADVMYILDSGGGIQFEGWGIPIG